MEESIIAAKDLTEFEKSVIKELHDMNRLLSLVVEELIKLTEK